ncbi:MAG: thioredoxin-disulfide reductase [Candidatus Merdivicinus sp.]|jgi:thioredoxin reductase (NADPH)
MTDLMILGAGTAGLSAAIYAVRAGLSVRLLENSVYGGQILNSPDVDNYPGIPSISGFDFVQNLHDHAAGLGVKPESVTVSRVELTGDIKRVHTPREVLEARAIILATGASHRKLGCAGETEFQGRGVSYCATCDGAFFRGKDVAIVGGGNTALEDALFLANSCKTVFLVHRREGFRAHQSVIDAVRARENIRLLLGATVETIIGDKQVTGIVLRSTKDESLSEQTVSGVFVAVGLDPNTSLFKGQLDLDGGYIRAGEDCRTSLPGVFAAGDVRTKPLRQLVTAASDGAVAAVEAGKYLS